MAQAPQPLQSKAVKRSEYLAQALKSMQETPQQIGGYGGLAARLGAQLLTKRSLDKAETAAEAETKALRERRMQGLASVLGVGASPAMPATASPSPAPAPASAPTADAADEAMFRTAGGGYQGQQAIPGVTPATSALTAQPQQQGLFGLADNERRLAQSLIASGDEAGLTALYEAVQKRNVSPNIQVGPDGTTYNADDPTSLGRTFANRENINNFLINTNDPKNEGKYFPDLQPGEEPLYDQNGNIVGVRNMAGAIEALGGRERASADAKNASNASYAGITAGAEAAARAPYQFVNVEGAGGQPITMSAAQAANGVFQGRSPEATVEAEANARNRAAALEAQRERASSANRILPSLAEMETRLPSVITGFGAGPRASLSNLLATAPLGPFNDRAERESTATQTFQNEARQVVSGILPLFGSNPTEGERNYAERMSGADVTLTPEALQEGINLARQRAAREQARYEGMLAERGGGQQAPVSREAALAEARRRGLIR